jgi:predicted metal-dependent phosphoesterase TrpH
MIDLHLHSTASDGLLTPSQVVRRAKAGGHRAIALTDHDTQAGVREALAEGERVGLEVVPGVEISLDHPSGALHVISLFVGPDHEPLANALDRLRNGRAERNARLAEKLTELGMPVGVEDAAVQRGADEAGGGGIVARPHFAMALLEKGFVTSFQEAFDLWIGKGRPAYVERYRLGRAEAFGIIRDGGGVSVLCHPATLGLREGLADFAAELRADGLDAIEIRYGEPDARREAAYREIAGRVGLLESGGSDFHGHSVKDQRIGIRAGNLKIPYEVLEVLKERAAENGRGVRP